MKKKIEQNLAKTYRGKYSFQRNWNTWIEEINKQNLTQILTPKIWDFDSLNLTEILTEAKVASKSGFMKTLDERLIDITFSRWSTWLSCLYPILDFSKAFYRIYIILFLYAPFQSASTSDDNRLNDLCLSTLFWPWQSEKFAFSTNNQFFKLLLLMVNHFKSLFSHEVSGFTTRSVLEYTCECYCVLSCHTTLYFSHS